MAKEEINLMKGASGSKGKLGSLELTLTKLTWWALGGLFSIGLIIGVIYFFGLSKQKQLEAIKEELRIVIQQEVVKEGLLVSLKQRSVIASKALEAAKPYGKLFPLLQTIAPQNYYTSLSIDDVGRSTVSLELPSVEDAVSTIANVLVQTEEKKLRNPQMMSFYLKETGVVQLSLSFIANL